MFLGPLAYYRTSFTGEKNNVWALLLRLCRPHYSFALPQSKPFSALFPLQEYPTSSSGSLSNLLHQILTLIWTPCSTYLVVPFLKPFALLRFFSFFITLRIRLLLVCGRNKTA